MFSFLVWICFDLPDFCVIYRLRDFYYSEARLISYFLADAVEFGWGWDKMECLR